MLIGYFLLFRHVSDERLIAADAIKKAAQSMSLWMQQVGKQPVLVHIPASHLSSAHKGTTIIYL